MPITPLPQFEADLKADLDARDREAYEALQSPSTMVIRFGRMRLIGEYPYNGDAKPGCGSKMVARTHRGTEVGEMLTSTCPNAGCSKSITRQEMLEYIENSGGRDYPFHSKGRVLRVATSEDLNRQAQHEQMAHQWKMDARARAERLGLDMKVIDAEMILGRELMTFYYTSEHRIDFRELVHELATEHATRIELRQVGARDEARLTADYERCGQYCCCKNFLKVLKPVSMRSAKMQKATLDPLKISGRCGRLMCCLRYEDQTYAELKKRLPNRKKKVGTPDGDGIVIDTQILTQLVLVRLDDENRDVAVPVEELTEPGIRKPKPEPEPQEEAPKRKRRRRRRAEDDEAGETGERGTEEAGDERTRRRRRRSKSGLRGGGGEARPSDGAGERTGSQGGERSKDGADGEGRPKRRRRRRRRKRGGGDGGGNQGAGPQGGSGSD